MQYFVAQVLLDCFVSIRLIISRVKSSFRTLNTYADTNISYFEHWKTIFFYNCTTYCFKHCAFTILNRCIFLSIRINDEKSRNHDEIIFLNDRFCLFPASFPTLKAQSTKQPNCNINYLSFGDQIPFLFYQFDSAHQRPVDAFCALTAIHPESTVGGKERRKIWKTENFVSTIAVVIFNFPRRPPYSREPQCSVTDTHWPLLLPPPRLCYFSFFSFPYTLSFVGVLAWYLALSRWADRAAPTEEEKKNGVLFSSGELTTGSRC